MAAFEIGQAVKVRAEHPLRPQPVHIRTPWYLRGKHGVIERRFGINNHDIATLEDLAADLKVTRERVRQIQMEALRVLRQMLRRKGVSKDQLF